MSANKRSVLRLLPVLLALLALCTTFQSQAQEPGRIYRIGILAPRTSADGAPFINAFRQGLRSLGWVEGNNIAFETRWAQGSSDRLAVLAVELVRLKVDLILAGNTQAAVAAKNATKTIPIVMGTSADPVALGLVESLSRPGANVTGLSYSVGAGTLTKQLELLKDATRAARIAVLANPGNPAHVLWMKNEAHGTAQALGAQLQFVEARRPEDFEGAFAAVVRERAEALLVLADSLFAFHRDRLQGLSSKNRLPAMYGEREYAEAGGLMSYGADILDNFRRSATYVDKILKGAKAADLPVQQPTKFEFIVNQKTAKTLGLKVPQSVLVRADEVIQ